MLAPATTLVGRPDFAIFTRQVFEVSGRNTRTVQSRPLPHQHHGARE